MSYAYAQIYNYTLAQLTVLAHTLCPGVVGMTSGHCPLSRGHCASFPTANNNQSDHAPTSESAGDSV